MVLLSFHIILLTLLQSKSTGQLLNKTTLTSPKPFPPASESFLNTPVESNNNSNNDDDAILDSPEVTTSSVLPSSIGIIHTGSISESTYNYVAAVTTYIEYPLFIVSLVCNVFSVVVYCQKQMKSPTSTILIALCGCDAIYSLAGFGQATLKLVYTESALTSRVFLNYGVYISLYTAVTFRRASFCYTFLVSAERFVAVSYPFQAKYIRLVKYPAIVCSLILVSALAFHIFTPLKYVVNPWETTNNVTLYRMEFSNMYVADRVHFENTSMASKFIYVYFMLMGCLFFNLLIVISLNRQKEIRNTLKAVQGPASPDKREKQTTVTIMVSTVVCVLLALPVNASSIVSNIRDDYGPFTKEHFLFLLMDNVGALCDVIRTCTNFIFYTLLSSKFRQTSMQLFIPCVKSKPIQGHEDGECETTDTGLSIISKL